MKLSTDYWHSLDKETAQKYSLSPAIVGISTPPFKDQLESLKTRIFQGASQVELGFTGKGKGSAGQGSITPEQISNEEREQIRLLAKINRVELSTHNTVGVGSLSGFDARKGAFDKEDQESGLHELRRTIDFAADVAQGGPIVVHTGEFPRPIYKYQHEKFQGYKDEELHAPVLLADPDTGQVIQLRRDIKILEPDYKDENGQKTLQFHESGDKAGQIMFKEKKYAEVEKEFFEEKEKAKKRGEQEYENFTKKYKDNPGVYFYNKYAEREILQARGDVDRYLQWADQELERGTDASKRHAENLRHGAVAIAKRAEDQQNQLNRVRPIEEIGVERSADALARGAMFALDAEKAKGLNKDGKNPLFIAPENIFPEMGYGSHPEELKELIQKSRNVLQEKLWDDKKHSPTKEGANLGVHSQDDAIKKAQDHIKATFDIGHLNTWRKYFQGSTDEFNSWVGKQVESLAKEKMIGHAHITDNFGYFDEHVTPGEGSAPIAGFIKKLMENDFKGKMIIEPGHQDVKAWTGAMRSFNSPIYRVDNRTTTWTDVENSYFGATNSPRYMVGGVTPGATLSEEYNDWRFWSRLPIE